MVKLLIKYTNEVIMIFDITKEYISLQWKKKNDSNSPYIVIYNKIDLLHKEVQKKRRHIESISNLQY